MKYVIKKKEYSYSFTVPKAAIWVSQLEKKWGAQITSIDRIFNKKRKEDRNMFKAFTRDLISRVYKTTPQGEI